ncbi:MAG: hypothetical protein NXI04_23610 [Planctomycetaceae bacterium]|nr:hypothetical protein [Planctomycetaceae bacterium]
MVKNSLRIRILLQSKIQERMAAGMQPRVAFQLLRQELAHHDQIDWEQLEFDDELCVIEEKRDIDDRMTPVL